MTSRERFHETMRYGAPDRVPYFEDGIRRDTLRAWHRQGLSRNTDLSDLFQIDRSYEVDLDYNPLNTLPTPATTRKDLSALKNHPPSKYWFRFLRTWQRLRRSSGKRDDVLLLTVHPGFFLSMGVYGWDRFSEVITLMANDPEFITEAMSIQGERIASVVDSVLDDLDVDAVIFSEPIGDNEGSLISPVMYENLVLQSYRPILDVLRKHHIDTVIMRTYANMRILVPSILKFGFNCLWACETNSTVMDYRRLRMECGKELRLIGGIDLDVLRENKASLQKEIEEKVLPLIADGGFIPRADGRVRKDIPFENYLFYRLLLERMLGHQ